MSEADISKLRDNKACPLIKYKEDPSGIHKCTNNTGEYIVDRIVITTGSIMELCLNITYIRTDK